MAQAIFELAASLAKQQGFGRRERAYLEAYLDSKVNIALEQALIKFSSRSGPKPKVLTCAMPYNPHRFRQSTQSKHCVRCKADYCDGHPLSNCVKCGASI